MSPATRALPAFALGSLGIIVAFPLLIEKHVRAGAFDAPLSQEQDSPQRIDGKYVIQSEPKSRSPEVPSWFETRHVPASATTFWLLLPISCSLVPVIAIELLPEAFDFFVAVTATFRLLYVLVVIEHRSRRLIHYNVTAHPNATWTLQQLREAVGCEEQYRFLIHDRHGIFSGQLDESIRALGIRVWKSAPHSPKMYVAASG